MIITIILIVIAIVLFAMTFIKMIKKNSTNYIYLLAIEFIGIFVSFIVLLIGKKISIFGNAFIVIISIIIPAIVLFMEKRGIDIDEIIDTINMKRRGEPSKDQIIETIKKHPKSYAAHKALAEYYEKNKELEKAQDEYYKLINLKPNEYKLYCNLADLQHQNGNDKEAMATLEEVLKLKPDFYEGSMMLGSLLYDNEKFKEALLVYNDILKYKPAEYDIYYALGMTYTRLNDFQSATEFYKKAATLNSLKDISDLCLGQISLIFNDYKTAEEYFFETKDSEDEKISAHSYLYLAKIKLIEGNKEQAIQYTNMALELYPKIIKKIEKEEIFAPILGKINVQKEKRIETKMTQKDEELMNYLSSTFNVVEKLTNNRTTEEIIKEKEIE